MSVQAMTWVFDHAEATLGKRLVLLAIANHADRDGRNSWASVSSIAQEARLSKRQAQYALRELEASGELREQGKSAKGTHVYELPGMVEGGADIAPGGVQSTTEGGAVSYQKGVQPIAPEPKSEPSKSIAAPRRDELFEVLAEVCSVDRTSLTPSARGELNRAVKELRGVGGTPEEARSRAARYRVKFVGADLTPSALAKHWPRLGGNGEARPMNRHEANEMWNETHAALVAGEL